jgi:hypothetical protein
MVNRKGRKAEWQDILPDDPFVYRILFIFKGIPEGHQENMVPPETSEVFILLRNDFE